MILGEIYTVAFSWREPKKVPLILAVIVYLAITCTMLWGSGFSKLKGIILVVRTLEYLRANCSAEEKDHWKV